MMPRTPSLSGFLLLLGLTGACALLYLRLNVDSIAKRYVADKLDEVLQGTNFTGQIGDVVYKPGIGFELHQFKFKKRGSGKEVLTADRVFVSLPTGTEELSNLDFEPKLVEIHGARLVLDLERLNLAEFDSLLSRLKSQTGGTSIIPVRIRDSSITMSRNGAMLSGFSKLALDLVPTTQTGKLKALGVAEGKHCEMLRFDLRIDSKTSEYDLAHFQAEGLVDKSIMRLLPLDIRFQGQPILNQGTIFHGRWKCSGQAKGNFLDLAKSQFRFELSCDSLNLMGDPLPVQFRNGSCLVELTNDLINVRRANGRIDDGRFQLSYRQKGLRNRKDWALTADIDNLSFNKRWLQVMPHSAKRFCEHFKPDGMFDARIEMGQGLKKKITARLINTSFSYHKFPYRLENCRGKVAWVGNRLEYTVNTVEHDQTLKIEGVIDNPGDKATYFCNFGTEGLLPIDEPMLRSLVNYPSVERAVRDFRLQGHVSGRGTIEKLTPGPNGIVRKQVAIRLHECAVRHRSFDYPIQHVNGGVRIVDEQFHFEDVTGSSTSGRVECNGHWNRESGLNLVFLCNSIPFDTRLRHALTPNLQFVWDTIRPQGDIGLGKVMLNYQPGTGTPDIRVQATLGGPNDG